VRVQIIFQIKINNNNTLRLIEPKVESISNNNTTYAFQKSQESPKLPQSPLANSNNTASHRGEWF
jgi:hypothetical protein